MAVITKYDVGEVERSNIMAANSDLTEEQVRGFFTALSNWGKWGATDQLGTLIYYSGEASARRSRGARWTFSVALAAVSDTTRVG